jgi:hypothetical protein
MRWLPILLLAAALGVSSSFLVACGDRNGLIPRSAADGLRSDLDQASNLVAGQRCRAAEAAVVRAQATAAELPRTVDADLRQTLDDNLQHVESRVRADCGQTTSTQTTNTTPTQTQPTTTTAQPTTTETTPTTTTTEPSPPPTTTTDDGGSSGSGSGGTPAGAGGGGRGGDGSSGGSSP